MKWCYQDDLDVTRSVVPRHPWCNQRASRNQRRQLRWTLLSSTMSNLLKQMKWWYPMSHLHSPRQVFIGWRPSANTAVGKRPYWEYDEQSIEQMKWCYLMSHSFASPISAVNHRRRVNLIHGASLIRLANSWTFDSPRQFMDLAYVTWFAAYQLT